MNSSLLAAAVFLLGTMGPDYCYAGKTITSLCQDNEQVVFSCKIHKKLVSVCSSSSVSPTTGFLYYRYGKAGEKPELVYPDSPITPDKAFRVRVLSGAKGMDTWIAFTIGDVGYSVFSGQWVYSGKWYGVLVQRPNMKVIEMSCTGANINNTSKLFETSKFPLTETGESEPPLPVPSALELY